MTLRQATDRRLSDIRFVFAEAGITEHTGRLRYHEGTREVAGRIRGVKRAFPELEKLKQSPGVIGRAIIRGKGKVYRLVRLTVERAMMRHGYTAPRRSALTVDPHRGRRYCVHCREKHTRGEHRFHGKGSFQNTHLFSFNPRRMRKKENPALIYSDIGEVSNAHKGQAHRCDPECKRKDHRYFHRFGKGKPMMIGLAPGHTITVPEGCYPILLWPKKDRARLRIR